MKKFNRYNYATFVNKEGKNVVVAISHHAGQTVKGSAVCEPTDEFDLEVGKKLAAARCNKKVLSKKISECEIKLSEVDLIIEDLKNYRTLLANKYKNYSDDFCEATEEIVKILSELN